jgi:hypothetical protein
MKCHLTMGGNSLNPVEQLVHHWKTIYQSDDPLNEIIKHDGEIPKQISNHFQFELYPEPFYGYLSEDISQDALLLLINPGLYEGSPEEIARLNAFTKERYATWTKDEYENEKIYLGNVNPKSYKWREGKRKQMERVIPQPKRVPFLHTMELFPYHSKKWSDLPENAKTWLLNNKTTCMNFEAIKYMAEHNKTKSIIGIGINWIDIFKQFKVEPISYKTFNNSKGNVGHRVFHFQLSENATPILIYVACSMHLPKDARVINYFEEVLSLKRLVEVDNG